MFNHSSWREAAADILGAPPEACEQLPQAIGQKLDCGIIWSYAPDDCPDVRLWCGHKKNTLKLGVLIRREQLWPGAKILNGHHGTQSLSLNDHCIGLHVEDHLIEFGAPAFMLCNDDVIRTMASWLAGLGVQEPGQLTAQTSMSLGVSDAAIVVRSLTRKAGLFVKDTPVSTLLEQARLERSRLIELARLALARPVMLPSTIPQFMTWLEQRFFTTENHPTSHNLLRQAYMVHAATILEVLWKTTHTSQLVLSSHHYYNYGPHTHAQIKHTMLRALSLPPWRLLRHKLLGNALKIKKTVVSDNNSKRKRKSLHAVIAQQALYLVFRHREDPEPPVRGWFSKALAFTNETVMTSAFDDIPARARSYYMMYALGDELERRGFAPIIDAGAHGLLEVKDWIVTGPHGKPVLRLDHDSFFPAVLATWERHKWNKDDVPAWVHQVVEARFVAGDLRVADMLAWHPERVRVLANVCGQNARRARWLVSWLAYHPEVVDPALMPALFLLDTHEIAQLNDKEISAIYENLERAPAELIRVEQEKTKVILACAVSRLGAASFDLLDRVLVESMNPDIMAHITSTIEQLPRLSSKRRALKREQAQALEKVQGAEHFGMLTVHDAEPDMKGALSHSNETD